MGAHVYSEIGNLIGLSHFRIQIRPLKKKSDVNPTYKKKTVPYPDPTLENNPDPDHDPT